MKSVSLFSTLALACGVVAADETAVTITNHANRRAAIGDFDEFNQLFENAKLIIPEEFEVSEWVGIARLEMTIRNMECMELSVGDIRIDHQQNSAQSIDVLVDINQLDITCEMEYDYTYGILRGDGWVRLTTDNNSASTRLEFTSADFSRFPPNGGANIRPCSADIEIENMDFEGDFVSEIIEIFQGLVRSVVEREIGEVVCDELGSLGTTLVEKMIDTAAEQLAPYQGALDEEYTDPLYAENNLQLPSTLNAVDLQNTESPVGKLFNQALESLDLFLGTLISDDSNGRDLAANIFLREYFLDNDRAFTLSADQLPLDSETIFEGHDKLFETKVTLHGAKIYGLDTLTQFNPFVDIGRRTLQNQLTWGSLDVVFDVTVEIKPSTLDDAILQDPTSPGITERISIDFGVDNVEVLASLLLVVDEDALGNLMLGPLMHTEHLVPCLLSTIHTTQLSGIEVDPQLVNEPTLNGFISVGVDRIITDSVEAAFAMYTGALRQSLPNIFQVEVRKFINTYVVDAFLGDSARTSCPTMEPLDGIMDYRELFDRTTYGDIPSMLKTLLDEELLQPDGDASKGPRINDALIAPFTKRQSGVEGELNFPGSVFGFQAESVDEFGISSIELQASSPSIKNLDTLGLPIDILKPNATNGYILENRATIGTDSEPLQFSLNGVFALNGDPALAMHNEMELSVQLANTEMIASIMAKLDANLFSTFPLRDISNADCWLATFASTLIDEQGILNTEGESGLSLERLVGSAPSTRFGVQCVNCSSTGLEVLPELIDVLEIEGVSNVLERRLVTLGIDILKSDYAQAYLNRLQADAALRCPNSPHFVDATAVSDYPLPALPSLPYDSLETVAFASTIIMQIATVVIAESHKDYDPEVTDALDGQAQLELGSDIRLANFTSLGSSIGEWAPMAIEKALEYVGSRLDNGELRVNSLLRSTLLDEQGAVIMEFNDLGLGGDDLEVSLKHVRVSGLDSISDLNIFDAIGSQTLHNRLKWDRLAVEVVVSLMTSQVEAGSGRSLKTMEDITISLELADIDVSLAMLLALDLDLLGSLDIASILEIKNILPCVLSAAHAAELTELQVTVGSIVNFAVNGFRSSDLSSAAADSSRVILENYGGLIMSSMPGFFDSTIRTLFNNWMKYHMGEWSSTGCPVSSLESAGPGFVDFRELLLSEAQSRFLGGAGLATYGDLFRTAYGVVKDLVFKVDPSTLLSAANDAIVSPLTKAQSSTAGSLSFPGDIFGSESRIKVGGLDANVQLRASDFHIDNLDTISAPLSFIDPINGEAYKLNNTATFGGGDQPVHLAMRLFVSLMGDDDMEIRNDVAVSMDLATAQIIFAMMLKVAEPRFYGFPLRDILDYNCWLASIPAPTLNTQGVRSSDSEPTASLADLAASVASLKLNVTCVECSSPRMSELTTLLSSDEAQAETTELSNQILDYVTSLLGGNFMQVQIDRALNDAARKCPHRPEYDANFNAVEYEPFQAPETDYMTSYLILLGSVTIALVLILCVVIFAIRCIVRRRHKKWLGTLPAHQVRRLAVQQGKEKALESDVNESTTSMFSSPDIPFIVRWGMPFVILGNIALFLSGHLSLGATVNIQAEIAGESFTIENFFEFSMARSTVDIWNAGGRELAIMILIFSGIWPYTKQLITLALWFMSPAKVSISKRGSILLWLDWLAKWSMIDIFVLVISIAAFRVSISSPDKMYLPDDFYSIDMLVVPLWGLYANMIAQLISQVSSHFIIHYHRSIANRAKKAFDHRQREGADAPRLSMNSSMGSQDANSTAAERTRLREHQFSRPHRGETEKLVVRSGVNVWIIFAAISLMVLVIIGCTLPSFSLEILGIIGIAVEAGQEFEDATTHHSVFSVLSLLMEEAAFLDTAGAYIGLGTLCALVAICVLFVPIIQSLALLWQWFRPATPKSRARMTIFVEILQAWQYAEVYIVAVFVASWQLGPVSEFMINAYCDSLKDTFAQLVYYGILEEDDAQCFSVRSSIESGSLILASGAVLLALISSFVTNAVLQYFRDRTAMEKRLREDIEKMSQGGSDNTSDTASDDPLAADGGFAANIQPVPVLFTDRFRWLLRQENNLPSSARALFADPSSDENWQGLPEATAVPLDGQSAATSTLEGLYIRDEHSLENEKAEMRDSMSVVSSKPSPQKPRKLSYNSTSSEDDKASKKAAISQGSSVSQKSLSSSRRSVKSRDSASANSVSSMPSLTDDLQNEDVSSHRGSSVANHTAAAAPGSASVGAYSTASSRHIPNERFGDEGSSVASSYKRQPLAQSSNHRLDDAVETATNDESLYYEETVDGTGDFEEYTVDSLGDIEEEEYFEEISYEDSQSARGMV